MKYNLPTFTGKSNSTLSIHQWIRKVEIAAKSQDWNEKQQTCMAQLSLEGPALTWLDTIQEDDMPWSKPSRRKLLSGLLRIHKRLLTS